MQLLQSFIAEHVQEMRAAMEKFIHENADEVIAEKVTFSDVLKSGLSSLQVIPCATSFVHPKEGLHVCGEPIASIMEDQAHNYLLERLFLRMVRLGKWPRDAMLHDFCGGLRAQDAMPGYIWGALRTLPPRTPPMVMMQAALSLLGRESKVRMSDNEGIGHQDRWRAYLADAVRIMAVMPELLAAIYRIRYMRDEPMPKLSLDTDIASQVSFLIVGESNLQAAELMQLFFPLHIDHESGNVSAHMGRLATLAWCNPYEVALSVATGLAGTKHGKANQDALLWLLNVLDEFEGLPTAQQFENKVKAIVGAGGMIPGFGHAVIKEAEDARLEFEVRWLARNFPDSNLYRLIEMARREVPRIFQELKGAPVYPNVDLGSGSCLYEAGIRGQHFYTCLFAAARIYGVLAQGLISMLLNEGLERPSSLYIESLIPFKAAIR